jgi:hypothetical protein
VIYLAKFAMVKYEVATSEEYGSFKVAEESEISEETLVWLIPMGQTTSVPRGIPMGCSIPVTRGPMRQDVLVPRTRQVWGKC